MVGFIFGLIAGAIVTTGACFVIYGSEVDAWKALYRDLATRYADLLIHGDRANKVSALSDLPGFSDWQKDNKNAPQD